MAGSGGKSAYLSPFSFEVVGLNMVVMAVETGALFLLNLAIEYGVFRSVTR